MTGRRKGLELGLDPGDLQGGQASLLVESRPTQIGSLTRKGLFEYCWGEPLFAGLFLILGLLVGLLGVESSGELWLNDGARYLNNGAMVRDWIDSGRWLDPFNFAKDNYVQFPSHSVPYHPPGYAVMLGIWFKIFGLSYASARAFIGLCLGLSLLAFRRVLVVLGTSVGSSTLYSLLFGSVPLTMNWSRTCMSELPGMMFILWGTFFFLSSLREQNIQSQIALSILAIFLALCAFMCRVTTAGVLPAWFLFLLKSKGFKASVLSHYPIMALLYLATGFFWVNFASDYSKNEMRHVIREDFFAFLNFENLSVWWRKLPEMVSPLVVLMACCGLAVGGYSQKVLKQDSLKPTWWFWSIWLACYYLFQVFQNLKFEARYFIYAVPAVVGLAIWMLELKFLPTVFRKLRFGFVALIILFNVVQSQFSYSGLTGYDKVAKQIGVRQETGNVMITAFADADLIFRLRCQPSVYHLDRQVVRGDRVLAIRNPEYSKAASRILAKTNSDVYDAIKQGRVRFVITEGSLEDGSWANTDQEVKLCHEAMVANPTDFELIGTNMLHREKVTVPIYTWMFRGELLPGKSSLPIVIPTSELTITQ